MIAPSPRSISDDPNILSALRELIAQHPALMHSGCETLSRQLFVMHYVNRRPEPFEVEAALEALLVEGEVLS
jgi:hypothetical protein